MLVNFIFQGEITYSASMAAVPAVGDEVFTRGCPCRVDRRKWMEFAEPGVVEIYLVEIASFNPGVMPEGG